MAGQFRHLPLPAAPSSYAEYDPHFTPGAEAERATISLAPPANATQIGGEHYKQCAIEPWDFAAANHMDGFQHAIIKYVTRWRGKDGVQALLKAQHYLEKYIELIEHGYPDTDPEYFIEQLQIKMLAAALPAEQEEE
jgi:Protein of unknwon function (DUF3310)